MLRCCVHNADPVAASVFPAASTLTVLPPVDALYIDDEALSCRMRCFPRLSTLSIGDGVTHQCTEAALRGLASIAGQLHCLQIGGLRLRTRNRHSLPEFRHVTSLQLIELHAGGNPNSLSRLLSRFPALQRLSITSAGDPVLLSAASICRVQLQTDGWRIARGKDKARWLKNAACQSPFPA